VNSREAFVYVEIDWDPQGFDLSRNLSLRTFETTADSISIAGDTAPDFLKTVLSSITSPAPLDVVIIYRERDFGGSKPCSRCIPDPICFSHYGPPIGSLTNEMLDHFLYSQQWRLRAFREMHSVREFRLVFCVDVVDCMTQHALQLLRRVLDRDMGEFHYLSYEPSIICERRVLRTRVTDFVLGSASPNVPASAL
jgi:hypothetical protein